MKILNFTLILFFVFGQIPNAYSQNSRNDKRWRNALSKKNLPYIRMMANKGYDVDKVVNIKHQNTGLHYATRKGFSGIVGVLLEAGASINIKNKFGITPLHFASMVGNMRIVRLLLKNGADLTIKDKKGQAPYHLAKKKGHRSIVQLLQREYRKMQRKGRSR